MGKNDFTRKCKRCSLAKRRRKVVFGLGSLKASLLLCGEAPGNDEDIVGKPFVGRSGDIVDQMLEALKISRNRIFITNLCLCRPVDKKGRNRKPTDKEIKACRPRLLKTLRQVGRYVVLFGSTASNAILGTGCYSWGRPQYCKKIGKFVMPVKHPSWYLHGNMKYLPFGITEFVDGVKELRKLSKLGKVG